MNANENQTPPLDTLDIEDMIRRDRSGEFVGAQVKELHQLLKSVKSRFAESVMPIEKDKFRRAMEGIEATIEVLTEVWQSYHKQNRVWI
jgi:tRNA A37 N6-isopentenylltransferase MiaA